MLFSSLRKGRMEMSGMLCLSALLVVLMSVSCSTSPFAASRDSVFGNYLVGRHAESMGDTATAMDSLSGVLRENSDDPELLYHLFFLNLSAGSFQEARELADSLPEERRDADLVRMFFGLNHMKAGDHDGALRAFASLSGPPSRDWIEPIASAWVLWRAGRREEALAELERTAADGSLAGFRHFHEAVMADLLGDAERADERYRLALKSVDGVLIRFVEGYGNFLERRNRKEDARRLYREYGRESVFGQDLRERRLLAMEADETPPPLVRNGLDGGAELFQGVYSVLADRERDNDAAVVWLRFALFLRSDFDWARILLAEQYRRFGYRQRALESYRAVPSDSPHYANAGIQTSRILEDMDRNDEALELLLRLRAEAPESRRVAVRLAEFHRVHERHDESIAMYSGLVDALETPVEEDWPLYFGRAVAYEQSGRWPQAEADLQVARKLSDEHPLVLNYLGYSWVDQGRRLTPALEMLKKAERARPQSGYIVDSLGWAYYKLGEFDTASSHLERAVELEPDDPIINDHFGDSLWRVGRRLEARFQWRRALRLEPKEDEIAVIEEKLLRGLPPVEND